MPRNISFSMTKDAFINRTKDVTRRDGWINLVANVVLNGCEKCQGLKRGEKVNKLALIKTVNVRREPLCRMTDDPEYGKAEVIREGFPELTPEQFVAKFCKGHAGVTPDTIITRIEYVYMDEVPS